MASKNQKEEKQPKKIKFDRRTAIIAVVIAIVSFTLCYTNVLYNFDKLIADPIYQRSDWTSNDIRIIAIDEATLAEYGDVGYWSRDVLANLINQLNADENLRPDAIVVDMLLISEKDPEGDAALAEACADGGNVIVGCNIISKDSLSVTNTGELEATATSATAEYPYDALSEAATVGFANAVQDQDGYIRYAQTTQTLSDGTEIPSLAYAAYQKYCEANGLTVHEPETLSNNIFAFPFSGKPSASTNHFFEIVSMKNVLNGSVDTRAFAGSVVLIGYFAPGMGDAYNVAILRGQQMYGVEIHANILQALIMEKTAVPANTLYFSIAIAIISVLFYLLIHRSKPALATVSLVVLIVADILAGRLLFDNGLVISLIELPLVAIVVYGVHLVNQYIHAAIEKAQTLTMFKTYVAPQIVERLTQNGEKITNDFISEKRDVAVLFCDIRGFTPLSEGLAPEQIVDILNHYLTLTTSSVFDNEGTLDKFIGDATMAIFNAPYDLNDYVMKAVKAGMAILAGREALQKMVREKYDRNIAFGIGIQAGPAVVGNIGCEQRTDFTAIGDVVNTSSRLESNAAPGQLLISEEVFRRLSDRLRVTPCGNIPLKGKSEVLYVFQVDQILDKPMTSKEQLACNIEDLKKTIAPTKNTKGGGHLIIDEAGTIKGTVQEEEETL